MLAGECWCRLSDVATGDVAGRLLWGRDQLQCQYLGAVRKLQFHHIELSRSGLSEMMKTRGQSGDIEEKNCPYGFIALEPRICKKIKKQEEAYNI